MSRSYRHSPCITDGHVKTTKENKRIANSKVRHKKDLYNGSAYKKLSCSYDIHDYISYWPKKDAIKAWYNEAKEIELGIYPKDLPSLWHNQYKNLNDFLNRMWAKHYKRK